jgi:hypothetical protein
MFFGLFGLLFPDCVPEVVRDSSYDTGDYRTVWLQGVTINCDVFGWRYDLIAWTDSPDNPPDSGTLTMQMLDGGYYEIHPLPEPSWSEGDQHWEYLLELERVYAEDDLVLGQTTLMPCTEVDGGMNWHLELLNDDTMDCAVFGTDPSALGYPQCSDWTP